MDNKEKALKCHEEWNGKLETIAKSKVNSREDLAIAYTPGVAEPCKVIAEDKEAAYKYTWKANTVAVVSDGSAVLGLGNIGPYAAMPVMEGKCVLFKEFGNVNAVPICLDTQDTEDILYDNCPDFSGFNVRKHGLKTGSLKVRTRITVVRVPAQIGKAVLLCIGFKDTLLVGNGITFALQLVLMG